MGKFVQLSTQIRTYRNCRGEGGGEGDALCFHVCVCVWLCVCLSVCVCRETQASLRPDTEYSKKKKSKKKRGKKELPHRELRGATVLGST